MADTDIVECEALILLLIDDFPVGDGYRYYAPSDFVADRDEDDEGRSMRNLATTFHIDRAQAEMLEAGGGLKIVRDAPEKAPVPAEPLIIPPAPARPEIIDGDDE